MSTRIKIFISYLVMGIVPLLLFLGITFFAMFRSISGNPFLMSISENTDNVFKSVYQLSKLEILAQENPKGLFDEDMLSDIDEVVSQYHIGIVLMDSENKQFYASNILERNDLTQKIQSAKLVQPRVRRHFDNEHFLSPDYRRLEIDSEFMILSRSLRDSYGTLFIGIETGSAKQVSNTLFRRFIYILLIGMAGLILFMTFMVTRSMMQSLKTLKNGVSHISEGDLDFSIKTNKRDEVAQVVMAFEEMRLRLKASIDTQMREDESRRELVTNISHDLRTPVTAIKGYAEGIIDGTANTPEKRERYMRTILSKTIGLDQMIDDLFLYSSLDVGKASYHFETVSAVDFFKNLCSEAKLDLEEKGFDVQCKIEIPADTKVRLDRGMIQRLQHNLNENAVKYCKDSDRKVVFSAHVKDGAVICSTEDNGAGIKSDDLPNIFERFYRADAARTSTVGGTGLGLQISKRIVEDHGGRIWAESSYGEFTRISWTQPVVNDAGTDVGKTGKTDP